MLFILLLFTTHNVSSTLATKLTEPAPAGGQSVAPCVSMGTEAHQILKSLRELATDERQSNHLSPARAGSMSNLALSPTLTRGATLSRLLTQAGFRMLIIKLP